MKQNNQTKVFAAGFILVILVIIWSLARPFAERIGGGNENSEEKINAEILKAPLITSEDLHSRIAAKEKLFIIDLRGAGEFQNGHISASQNSSADENEIQKKISEGADKNSSIIFLNQGENVFEAAKIANDFVSKGFVNAKYLQGGFSSWQNQAFPVVSGGISPSDESKLKTVDTDQLIEDLDIGENAIQFVDVRDPESFQKEHIKGAVNIPLEDLESNSGKISGIKKIIIYGKDEDQAKKAAVTLFDLNFFNAYVLKGNIEALKNSGK
ncbi:MAG: rhodanese-like domain-containing protein [Parcubacteria group bacterium]|jgi:rhodanese-related sulfurtransferase